MGCVYVVHVCYAVVCIYECFRFMVCLHVCGCMCVCVTVCLYAFVASFHRLSTRICMKD